MQREERERIHNLIRGAILAAQIDNAAKRRALEEMDRLSPPCPECNVEMVAEMFKCSECGPTG